MLRSTDRCRNRCARHCSGTSRRAAWRDRAFAPGNSTMHEWQPVIEAAWEGRGSLDAAQAESLRPALDEVMDELESGRLRVAEPDGAGGWKVHAWIKQAILDRKSTRLNSSHPSISYAVFCLKKK